MAALPIFQSENRDLTLLQTNWAASLNPLLSNPLSSGLFLKSVALANGVTVINHLLGRMPQGWIVSDISGAATVYRSAVFTKLTLTLTSSAAVTVNLYVF